MIHKYILPVVAGLGLIYAVYYVSGSGDSPRGSAAVQREPTTVPSTTDIAGSGIVEPQGQMIEVASPLPGVVESVIGDDRVGTRVEKGEILLQLDGRQHRAELEVQRANLAAATAQLVRLQERPRKEELVPLEAKVREAQVAQEEMRDRMERANKLHQNTAAAISEEDLKTRKFAYDSAVARVQAVEADLQLLKAGSWSADLIVAQAAVQLAEAQVRQAEAELERLVVKARSPGQLLKVDVRPQEYVGAPAGKTLILLGNVDELYVRVDIDEHDAPRYRAGSAAVGYLRGKLDHGYPLDFVRVEPYIVPKASLTGDLGEYVDTRVLQVIYRLQSKPDPAHPVYVGQQMDVYVENAASDAPSAGS